MKRCPTNATREPLNLVFPCQRPWELLWVPLCSRVLALAFTLVGHFALGQGFTTNTYTASSEDFANPERGFYIQADSYASAPSSVSASMASYRINGKGSPGNTYTAKISLLLRLFYLDTFVNASISASFLNAIQADFDSIRAQGCKAVLRFAYNQDQTRPFDEPSKARILAHIEQLKPVLKQNSDVIAVLQHGFIGAWGEGYYTDIFYTGGLASAQNWIDRAEVINALLAALPAERMMQVRTPQMKQKFVHGPTAPTGSSPLSPSEAFSGSGPARIGFYNDCFLADATDMGTFSDYDIGGGTSVQDTSNLRNYLALDTRFTPMGGETCAINPPTDDCASAGGRADTDMAIAHYSFLNQSYNRNVNDDWVAQGCIENIKRQLGYRLQLVSGRFRTEAQPGQAIPLTLEFQNVGYAAPFNPRGLELVLRHTVTGQKLYAALSRDTDARRWLPGTNQVLSAQLSLPVDLPLGGYDLLLNLPDPAPTLYGMIPYSVRLANSNALSSIGTVLGDVWEPATGYHRLRQTLTVNAAATNALPNGTEIPVLNFSAVAETYDTWKARNFPSNPGAGAPDGDPDADGRPNLVEYAVGSNPNSHDSNGYLDVSFDANAFYVSVRKGPGGNDVRYEIESSPNLVTGSWSSSLVTILENNAARLRVRYDGTTAGGFLRLKFALIP
jgi:hypothetical protein